MANGKSDGDGGAQAVADDESAGACGERFCYPACWALTIEVGERLWAGDEPVERPGAFVQAPRCGETQAAEGRKAEAGRLRAPERPPVAGACQTRK